MISEVPEVVREVPASISRTSFLLREVSSFTSEVPFAAGEAPGFDRGVRAPIGLNSPVAGMDPLRINVTNVPQTRPIQTVHRHNAFTLIELLVVMAIIAILA